MKVKTSVSFKEYAKLLLKLTYRKPIMIVIVFVAFAMLVWIITAGLNIINIPQPTIYQYITLGLITVVQPLVIYHTIWNNYHSSSHLKERLEMELDFTHIHITGESFYTKLTWQKTYKVVELKNWFLIYQNNLSAVIIPKKSFADNQIEEFKKLLKEIPGLDLHPADSN